MLINMTTDHPDHLYHYVDGKSNKEWGYTYDNARGVLTTFWRRVGAPTFQTNTKEATPTEVRKLVDAKVRKGYYISGTSLDSRHHKACGEHGWTLARSHESYRDANFSSTVVVEGIRTAGQKEVIEEVGGVIFDSKEEADEQAALINVHAEVGIREYSARVSFDGRPLVVG